jgi:NAD(P)-dependent dehydrogenase (short-subunit alcohol dehydrogenase family)
MVSSATRRILVTGANKGVGYAIVQRCLTDHDDTLCILGCRSRERGEAAVASLCAVQPAWRSRLLVCELDTSSDESVQTAAATVAQAFGASPPPLHGIVNNAGVAAGTLADVLNVNVRGPRRVDTAFIPLLCPDGGRIVQMGSGLGASCVSKCDEARQAFFLNPDVTWEQIDALMSEVLGYPAGEKELAAHGIGQNMGAGQPLDRLPSPPISSDLLRSPPISCGVAHGRCVRPVEGAAALVHGVRCERAPIPQGQRMQPGPDRH